MRVLGVDPGMNATGYAIIDCGSGPPKIVEAGVIRSRPGLPLEQRLLELSTGLEQVFAEFRPDVVAIEDLYAHYAHPKTAVIMGHARGVYFLLAGKAGVPVYSYGATRIKKSVTGAGHATKDQVAKMLANVLNHESFNCPADVTDAVAAALCHISSVPHGG
jgi:crossover junction endodeoxyribonuclease RuvC